MKSALALALIAAVSAGCASGFNRRGMMERLRADKPVFTDPDLRRIEQLRPQLAIPFKMAVATPFEHGLEIPGEGIRSEIESWGKALKAEGLITELTVLPRLLISAESYARPSERLAGIRAAAARCGADAVLYLASVTDVDRYLNPLSVFNLTIAGMWVFPGHHRDALTLMEGVLLDNRNEYLYLIAEGEGTASTILPYAYVEDERVTRKSTSRAFESFGKDLLQKCRGLGKAAGAPAGPPP